MSATEATICASGDYVDRHRGNRPHLDGRHADANGATSNAARFACTNGVTGIERYVPDPYASTGSPNHPWGAGQTSTSEYSLYGTYVRRRLSERGGQRIEDETRVPSSTRSYTRIASAFRMRMHPRLTL